MMCVQTGMCLFAFSCTDKLSILMYFMSIFNAYVCVRRFPPSCDVLLLLLLLRPQLI